MGSADPLRDKILGNKGHPVARVRDIRLEMRSKPIANYIAENQMVESLRRI